MDSGLAGLIAAETVLSHSDGARGILWVRGHTLPELVADFGYEGAVGLLWEGFAGTGLSREEMRGPRRGLRAASRMAQPGPIAAVDRSGTARASDPAGNEHAGRDPCDLAGRDRGIAADIGRDEVGDTHPRKMPPVFFVTSATIFTATASISWSGRDFVG